MTRLYRLSLATLLFFSTFLAEKATAAPEYDERNWQPAQKESDLYNIEYDDNTQTYTFYNKESGNTGTPAKVMNSEEFRKYQFDNSIKEAWVSRRSYDETGGSRGSGSDDVSRLIPKFRLNSALTTSILGSDLIDINLQGAVEVLFGYKWTKTDNPTVAEEYRSHGIFDFDVKYQLNASGKIGDKINLNFVNSTDLTFDFQDLIKIDYAGGEDDIIQKIEAGNVNLPLSGSLITGSQSLFGFRTDLKFGNLTIEAVASQQKGQSSTINVKGGAQTTLFEIDADKYDANRHFFLSHYFRDHYNDALKYSPLIQSGINITRIEVWVTNRSNNYSYSRNIIALDTLNGGRSGYPSNGSNALYTSLSNNAAARNMSTVNAEMAARGLAQGQDFEKIENARLLTAETEYKFNSQLGYISLNTALNGDEVLGVAFEYTVGGRTYRVGEFADEGVAAPQALFVALLKGSNLSPRFNTWNLMMKNVYNLETYQLTEDDFTLNIMYYDESTGANAPFISEGNIKNQLLLQVLNLDNQNSSGSRFPDGKFDYIEGVTVQSNTGRVIFPVLEPFGRDLGSKIGYPTADNYVYNELYDSTLVKARQYADKNKFKLTGYFKSSSASEIILNATDIPEGAVIVTAGGIKLVENVDYTVNYALGRVQIINPAYMGSNVPLQVSVESLNNFSFVNKTLLGTNLKYKLSKNFNIGGTILHLSERPQTQKVTYGDEPISNTIWGINFSYQTQAAWLTKLVDAIPLISTKEVSNISIDGEFAQLIPGHSNAIGKSGTSYIDDFESTKMTVDLKQFTTWYLGSTPEYVSDGLAGKYFKGSKSTDIDNGYNRGRIAWYVIDPLFLRNTSTTPSYMRDDEKTYRKNHYVREVAEKEIFPNKDQIIGVDANLSVLNVAYYPKEKGPYNYVDFENRLGKGLNSDGTLKEPETNFGAITKALSITDFENSNIEYIEFWMLDPFIYNKSAKGGKLFFNLGDVSEDVLKDGRKSFENGIPFPYDTALMEETKWGLVPKVQSMTNTFDNNSDARAIQDVGYDGLSSVNEREFFNRKYSYIDNLNRLLQQGLLSEGAYQASFSDPSSDDYHYYRGNDYDQLRLSILERYKKYNNIEGNSPIATGGLSSSATTMPNTEDINKDNTLNELESYYEYMLDLTPQAISPENVGRNYIADVRTFNINDPDYDEFQTVHWYQFKIPVSDGKAFNNIEDFKSIKFLRMMLSGFEDSVVLRFAKFDLVRGEWRKYDFSLVETQEGTSQPEFVTGSLDVSAVSIEENAGRRPVNYLLPPGISRVIDNTTNQQYQRNEQSMMLTITDLADGDARAVYKSATYDMRNFKRLVMDVHAEAIDESQLKDGDLSIFIRLGNDYRYNYYEYEIPLKLTPHATDGGYNENQREIVWPVENKLDIPLEIFTNHKLERNRRMRETNSGITLNSVYKSPNGNNTVSLVGNPNLGEVRVLMIGVRNPGKGSVYSQDDGMPKSGIVWVNELRMTNFDESGGWAANMRISANLADFGNVSLAGSIARAGFGALDTRVSERSTYDTYNYDLNTSFELGKFFPSSIGVSLPIGFSYSENFVVPRYNPFDPDILLKKSLEGLPKKEQDSIRDMSIEYAMRKSITLNNIRITGGEALNKLGPIAPGNFTFGYSFNESLMHNINTERDYEKDNTITGAYVFGTKAYSLEPFKNSSIKSEWFKIIKDFNLALYPNQLGFSTDYNDKYTEYIVRSFYPGVIIQPIQYRERINNRNYTLSWDITQKLKFTFNARNSSRQDISMGHESDTLDLDQSWRNTHYGHDYSISYTLPINKLPILSWTNVVATYKATYDWDAPTTIATGDMPYVGNTVRNSNNFQVNTTLNFVNLYGKSKFLKEINQKFDGRSSNKNREMKDVNFEKEEMNFTSGRKTVVKHNLKTRTAIKAKVFTAEGTEVRVTTRVIDERNVEITTNQDIKLGKITVTGRVPVPENPFVYAGKLSLRLLMSIRNINLSYTRGGETTLPGYTPQTTIIGLDERHNFNAPGWDFILGSQSSNFWGNFYGNSSEYMLGRAHTKSWVIQDTSTFIDPFTMRMNTNLTFRSSVEPIRDLRIEITANHSYSNSKVWYDINYPGSHIATESGSFTMSTIAIGSAFENPKSETYYKSDSYNKFANSRLEIANMLAADYYGANNIPRDSLGFPVGFSGLSQDVLMPAFAVGYLGKSVDSKTKNYTDFLSKIPLPNWQITYSGLSRISALKPFIKSANISHSYRATYSIGSYTTNTNFLENPTGVDGNGDFYTQLSITSASLTETIQLGSLDVTWANSLQTRFEVRKNRRIELSLNNNQIVENGSWEGTAGVGYTFADVPQILTFGDKAETTSITLRADFTFREDKNIIRKLAEDTHQITNGQRNMAVKFTSDYLLMKDLTFRIYFDWIKNNPYVSGVNTSNIAFGFSLRYVLGL